MHYFPSRLLIVEDDTTLRNYLSAEFSSNYHVIKAEDGLIGIEKCIKYIPDIIISDIRMPNMNGYEMCKKIKTDVRTCHIPIILLTRYDDELNQEKGYNMGADAYVPKPFSLRVLKARAHAICKSRKLIETKLSNTCSTTNFKDIVINCIETNLANPDFKIDNLADQLSISRTTLYRRIKASSGKTANYLIREIRLEKAAILLVTTSLSINEISFQVGILDVRYFTDCFKKQYKSIPSTYRKDYNQCLLID